MRWKSVRLGHDFKQLPLSQILTDPRPGRMAMEKNHGWNYSVWGFPGMEVPQNGIKWCFIREKSETYMDDDLGGTPILGNHHLDVEKYEI